ncbi:MAG: phasin family protein [Gemmobacter sp.]|nr:phasin family protein [Gemmobacter sp.]
MATSNKAKSDANPGAPAMTAAMMAFSPAVAKAWSDMMSESARFLTDRLQHDLETQKALLACKSPTDLLQVQAEFFRSAMEQYSAYTTHLYTKLSTTVESTVKDVASSHPRKYDDVPL